MISRLLGQLFQELQLWLASQRWCLFPARLSPQSKDIWCKDLTWNLIKYGERGPCCECRAGVYWLLRIHLLPRSAEQVWSWMWTRAMMNIYSVLQRTKGTRILFDFAYINLIRVHYEPLELLYAKCYTLRWANGAEISTGLCRSPGRDIKI